MASLRKHAPLFAVDGLSFSFWYGLGTREFIKIWWHSRYVSTLTPHTMPSSRLTSPRPSSGAPCQREYHLLLSASILAPMIIARAFSQHARLLHHDCCVVYVLLRVWRDSMLRRRTGLKLAQVFSVVA